MNPKISIIVPVYKVEKYLEKCIDSILNQTFSDFELILIDDGSPDSCGEICERYALKDKRIKVIHQKNSGPSVARNTGLDIAKGEYIGFCDSDDFIEPLMYEQLYKSCKKNNSELSIIGIREINEAGVVVSEYIPDKITFGEILKRSYPPNKLFSRKLFENNDFKFSIGRFYEDLELIPRIFIKCNKVSSVEAIGYNYLKREGSTTNKIDDKILDYLLAYVKMKEYLNKEKLYKLYEQEFKIGIKSFNRSFFYSLYSYPLIDLIKNIKFIVVNLKKIGALNVKEFSVFITKRIGIAIMRTLSLLKKKVLK